MQALELCCNRISKVAKFVNHSWNGYVIFSIFGRCRRKEIWMKTKFLSNNSDLTALAKSRNTASGLIGLALWIWSVWQMYRGDGSINLSPLWCHGGSSVVSPAKRGMESCRHLTNARNQWRNFVIFLCRQDGSSVGSTACLILNLNHAWESDQLLGCCRAQ